MFTYDNQEKKINYFKNVTGYVNEPFQSCEILPIRLPSGRETFLRVFHTIDRHAGGRAYKRAVKINKYRYRYHRTKRALFVQFKFRGFYMIYYVFDVINVCPMTRRVRGGFVGQEICLCNINYNINIISLYFSHVVKYFFINIILTTTIIFRVLV